MSGLTMETRMSNLKSVALTVLERLGFNAPFLNYLIDRFAAHTDAQSDQNSVLAEIKSLNI